MTVPKRFWWKDSTVYQIYPASFKDSNGDGLGDIPGIISKVDYIKDLGIDVVWLCPMYESPQFDMGYDISNYEGVHAPYGTVEDIEVLIKACHDRGMRLILDLVINHTSHEHAWFKESRSSKDNPKRDWYVWRPARYIDGKRMPPNNWRSFFSGSAWQWDETTQEYYLHLFATEQPDLNWENPETREAIYNSAMRFWLEKGIDGFRIDTVNMYSKGDQFPDAPIVDLTSFEQPAADLFCNGPRMHEFLEEIKTGVLDRYDYMTVGELPNTHEPADVLRYVSGGGALQMVFQFSLVDLGNGTVNKYDFKEFKLTDLKDAVRKWQKFIDGTTGWTTAFCENHDQGRSVSRFGSDLPQYREISAKMLAIMMSTLTGTLFVYQGQEIGMINCPSDWPIDDYQDIESVNYYKSVAAKTTDKKRLDEVMKGIQILGRDHARIPMQWDDSPNAGFTKSNKPWMRVHDLYPEINVAKQQADKSSVLNFWKKMLRLRKEHRDVFIHGTFDVLDADNERVFVYTKTFKHEKILVALNFTSEEQPFRQHELIGEMTGGEGKRKTELRLLVDNFEVPKMDSLMPYEGRVYSVY